ncbi:restriction endonuclease subunit S [Riemerella anatipestifer]|nr:restriction endonuclease subunit S [Riemerella anatipestifer]
MKQTIGYKYLDFVAFTNFDLWDVKRYTSRGISSNFPIVDLGSCIREENKKYKLSEQSEKEFGILGVNNKEGIFDAYLQRGKDIKQAYKKMEVGWIAYNPYRINVGSIGIRLEEHQNEYISPAYVVFSCLENLSPDFLFLLFKTERFNRIINENTTGSVRQNLTVDTLKKLQIPLPSLAEQEAIVKAYQTKINQAQNLEHQAQDLEQEIERYFLNELGIKNVEKRIKTVSLNIIEFNNIEKWGVEFNLGSNNDSFLSSQIFKNEKLENLVEINPRTNLLENDKNISFIPMECVSDDFGEIIELKSKKISESKGYTKFQENDLIWARITPCMQNGKSAIVSNLENKLGCGSTEFHVIRNNNTSNTHTEYIYHILRLKIVLNRATSYFTGSAGQQRVPKSFLEELVIPVPPIDVQVKISNKLSEIKTNIKTNITQAKNLKHQAEQEFEQAIFS